MNEREIIDDSYDMAGNGRVADADADGERERGWEGEQTWERK